MTRPDHAGLPQLLSVATVTRPHGVKGAVRIACSEQHHEFLASHPDVVVAGRRLRITHVGGTPHAMIVQFDGIDTRTDAEQLRGALVEAERSELPALADDEYYLDDLRGCIVYAAGERVGEVRGARALPANAVLDIVLDAGGEVLAPLTRQAVPVVDVARRRIEVDAGFLGIAPGGSET